MAEQVESKPVGGDASNDKVLAAVATLPLVGLIMFYAMKDASPIVKNYAKQSNAVLAISIVAFVVGLIGGIVIPIIGGCVGLVFNLLSFAAWVMLLIKALNNEEKYVLPVIGEYFDKLLK